MNRSLITRRSPRTGTAGSARATCSDAYSKRFSSAACWKGWWAAKALQSTRASSRQMRTGSGLSPAAEAKKLAEGNGASRAVREYLDALDANSPGRAEQRLRRAAQWGFDP